MTLRVFNVGFARNSSVKCAHRSALRSWRTDAAARGRQKDRDGSIYSDAREFRSKWPPRHGHLKTPTGSAGGWSCWPWGAALADPERIGTGLIDRRLGLVFPVLGLFAIAGVFLRVPWPPHILPVAYPV